MSLAPPTVAQLSEFSGRPEGEYSSFAVQALAQAAFLMEYATALEQYPEREHDAKLLTYGILDAADNIYLAQQFKQVRANPFASETIGSYSYTKIFTAVRQAEATGLSWFDMAVQELGQRHGFEATRGVSVFERDDLAVDAATGNVFVAGPANRDADRFPFDVSQTPPFGG